MARRSGSAMSTGRQSAVLMPSRMPGVLVIRPSPLSSSAGRFPVNAVNDCRMNLVDGDDRPRTSVRIDGAQFADKQFAIAGDVFRRVFAGGAQVQRPASVGGADASLPGAEAMHQPSDAGQVCGRENLDVAGIGGAHAGCRAPACACRRRYPRGLPAWCASPLCDRGMSCVASLRSHALDFRSFSSAQAAGAA